MLHTAYPFKEGEEYKFEIADTNDKGKFICKIITDPYITDDPTYNAGLNEDDSEYKKPAFPDSDNEERLQTKEVLYKKNKNNSYYKLSDKSRSGKDIALVTKANFDKCFGSEKQIDAGTEYTVKGKEGDLDIFEFVPGEKVLAEKKVEEGQLSILETKDAHNEVVKPVHGKRKPLTQSLNPEYNERMFFNNLETVRSSLEKIKSKKKKLLFKKFIEDPKNKKYIDSNNKQQSVKDVLDQYEKMCGVKKVVSSKEITSNSTENKDEKLKKEIDEHFNDVERMQQYKNNHMNIFSLHKEFLKTHPDNSKEDLKEIHEAIEKLKNKYSDLK